MGAVADNLKTLLAEVPAGVKLVAVSKFKPAEAILEAYAAGQRRFGENRPQELAAKAAALPADIEWHFIGHLQTNKIKYVIPCASLIESVDSLHLLEAISAAAVARGVVVDCLLEVHVAAEESKTGFTPDEAVSVASRSSVFPGVRLRGIMAMATNTSDEARVRADFRTAHDVLLRTGLSELSMGMSGDWRIAVEEGATIIRIGSAIFGAR
ncbi:MAG: YggS family pyridoxal phosphate-dependent enzyme [Bacteroidales bacterium]|nr:YggS family pyridoxal phosphate-dependent enzyme [Bacteroidales bacterium]